MSKTVLLIEDNEQNRYLATFLLEKNGYQVVSATTGMEGIELASQILPHSILLDIQLPGMDGYEVARNLRQRQELQNTPIIAVTSYAMVGDREKALESGCTGYIEKPIDPESFIQEIERYCGSSGGSS